MSLIGDRRGIRSGAKGTFTESLYKDLNALTKRAVGFVLQNQKLF